MCSLLNATGVAGHLESWFRKEDRAEYASDWELPQDASGKSDPHAFLTAAKRAGQTENGVVGVRIMAETLDELIADHAPFHPGASTAEILASLFGRIRAILLKREDTVAQAVSRLKAEQSGHWHTVGDWVEQTHPPQPLSYDASAIARYKAEVEVGTAAWHTLLTGADLPVIPITYEELARAPGPTAQHILDTLGLPLPDGHRFEVKNLRLADATSRDWIARFRAEHNQIKR